MFRDLWEFVSGRILGSKEEWWGKSWEQSALSYKAVTSQEADLIFSGNTGLTSGRNGETLLLVQKTKCSQPHWVSLHIIFQFSATHSFLTNTLMITTDMFWGWKKSISILIQPHRMRFWVWFIANPVTWFGGCKNPFQGKHTVFLSFSQPLTRSWTPWAHLLPLPLCLLSPGSSGSVSTLV